MNAYAEAVQRALRDPDWFCEAILRSPNHPRQSEFMHALADLDRLRRDEKPLMNHDGKRRFTVRAPHGKGKTHLLAKCAFWWLFTRRGRVPCTAPKEQQLRTRLWPEMRKLHAGAIKDFRDLVVVFQTSVAMDGNPDWCAIAETASQPENLAGFHDKWLLFIVDEASGVEQKFIEVIDGALTDPGNVLILSGNTTQTTGEFYASHMREKTSQLYFKMHITREDEPRDKRWEGEMISKYGERSPVVQVRVFGEFVDMQEGQLINLAWLVRAREKFWEEEGSHPRFRLTCDVADGGEDETIVTVAQVYWTRTRVRKQYRFSFPASESPIMAADAVERIWKEWGCDPKRDDIVVDAMGVGAGTAGALLKRGYPVTLHRGGEAADDPARWRCRRVQSYIVARDALRDGSVWIDPEFCDDSHWDDFTAQMTSVKSKPGRLERVEDLETKADLRMRGVKSPDMADSFAMLFTGQRPTMARGASAGVFTVPGVGARMQAEVF
jgi:phage terminase large subunit